jgi:hypothetical protein
MFAAYKIKSLLGNSNSIIGRDDILNQQLGMKAYRKLIMIMHLN